MRRSLGKIVVPHKCSAALGTAAAAAAATAVTALWVKHLARKAERGNPPVGRFCRGRWCPASLCR